jgi:transporter family protein
MRIWWVWAILGAVAAGATNVLVAAGMKGTNSYLATAMRTLLILPVVWIIAFSFSKVSSLGEWTGKNWLFLALSAIASGLSWVCAYKAIELAGAARPGPIDKSSLVITALLAFLFLGETITPRLAIAILLVTAGAIVSVWK